MPSADVLIFMGDGMRTLEHGVLIIEPSIELANIATRVVLLDRKLAESFS
ncbi:hypothetical protein PHYSODRAFT_327385 [Phytophthora sojae]|uniref:Uncharacterized protein n=1 Tax=Phytophthora sojae (strain P6497) TaxID=1094619 RepID=G4Z7Z8_PHYSP|nr:hypothetical protein PHYSODRAFT_327385 [Phytophthora sojae]EGZ19062.1 hypothetical protein PHYSODRAFT_327385 [Phytophthora sojae]|eukprot:XP_009521779.1 hypothetical protein PHYSODRAFT_327385 [Phytophthora sojae]